MNTTLTQKPVQGMRLNPALVLGAKVLQMSNEELEQTVRREIEENPALELEPSPRLAASMSLRSFSLDSGSVAGLSSEPGPMASLESELRISASGADLELGLRLLYSLDERGYVATPLAELASEWRVSEKRLERALALLQGLDPAGIGARDLQECLLLQCAALTQEGRDCGIAPRLIREAWQAFLDHRWQEIVCQLGVTFEDLETVRQFIVRNLYPYPLALIDRTASPAGSAWSDLVLRAGQVDGAWRLSVEVPAQEALELRISEAFGSVLEQVEQDTGNRTDAEWAIPYVRRARDLIVALGRRWETLRCIGEYLALKQEPFVLGSAAQPCPLTRRAVAQALGLHESTIGRAISGKTVLLPGGRIVPLSVFFGVAPLQADLDRVLRLQQEHGLSDRQVAEALRSQGIEVSRRTVAKYRKEGTSPQAIGPLKRHGS